MTPTKEELVELIRMTNKLANRLTDFDMLTAANDVDSICDLLCKTLGEMYAGECIEAQIILDNGHS